MKNEIEEIIKKNLPQEVGENLKKVLEKGVEDASKVAQLEREAVDLRKEIFELKESIDKYRLFDQRNAELKTREEALKESERVLEINTLKFQLECEKEKTTFTKEVAMGLVRNTNYRKNVFESENTTGYSDGNGNWIQPGSTSKNHDETITED